jgi:hypothetical protein
LAAASDLQRRGGVPSLEHEAPLVVLREQPALVPALLREALGMTLPAFARVELDDADLTQALPAERRADLVVHLRRAEHDGTPVMGVIVEVQRTRDEAKRWAWPAYAAALHARSRCPICLVVLAADARPRQSQGRRGRRAGRRDRARDPAAGTGGPLL